MSALVPFERSVFINGPFDKEYAPILQAIAFCVTDLGYVPRLAPENPDNAVSRLDRIMDLVRGSRYGIHDLSRCKSTHVGEYARLNMPFELGLDHACARFGGGEYATKSILVLEADPYDTQRSLSDIAGWDVKAHENDHLTVVRAVRDWFKAQTANALAGATRIAGHYADFQQWYYEREIELGASEEDIQEYPTVDVVRAMQEWSALGRPL